MSNTIVASATARGTATEAADALSAGLKRSLQETDPKLVMVFASTDQPLAEVVATLAPRLPGSCVVGASSAGEFTQAGDTKGSVVAIAVAGDYIVRSGIGTNLRASYSNAVNEALRSIPEAVDGYPYRTATLLLDPFAGNGEATTLEVAARLGPHVRLAGGAAGDDLRMQETWVACGSRAERDAVVITVIFSKSPLGVGVCHAHEPISEPLTVTKAEGNVVYEVNGEPAWMVWKQHTEQAAKRLQLDPDHLDEVAAGQYLLRFEAALPSGSTHKIRAPLSMSEKGALNFACGMAEGTVFRICESEPADQIRAAHKAAQLARTQLDGPAAGAIVFDCICRNIILQERFGEAVRGMAAELGNVPLGGFETYGEIALDVGDMSGFHNTTTVVLAFPKK
ncbi:MAG: FIST N-terminal domain-containing protein [Myxococcota bacterium]